MSGSLAAKLGKNPTVCLVPWIIVMGFILSCSLTGAEATAVPTATNTPLPTDTPQPTAEPTATDTLEPTTDKAATRQAEREQTAAAKTELAGAILGEVKSKLDEVGEIMGSGEVMWYDPTPIAVESSKPNMMYYQLLDPPVSAANFALHSNVMWETKQKVGLVNCMILFRVGEDISMDPWYVMRMGRISGLPHVWFQLYQGWSFVTESEARASNYIRDESGAANELLLVIRDTQFTLYANGHQVNVWWNSKQDRGNVGFATWQDTGSSVCTFSDNWIWEWSS
jgi:hypothetical protein